MVSDQYGSLEFKRRSKVDVSQIQPDHSTISSLSRISNDLDEKLKKVSACEDSAYLIEQTALMQTEADNIIAQKKQELSVSDANFNPSDPSFKNLEETVVKQMEANVNKIVDTLPLSLRASYKNHALNIQRDTKNNLKKLKIDLLTDSSKNRVLKTTSVLSDNIMLDPSSDTFENSVNQIKALTEVLPVSKSEQEKYLNTAQQSFGQAQGEALKNKNPELLVRWYYGFNQPQPLQLSVQSLPQDSQLKAGIGKEASHVVAETKSSESKNIAGIIKEDKAQEDLPPVTLEQLNKKSSDIPFKGWEHLTIEQKQALINGAIGKLSAKKSAQGSQSEKFLTDAETIVKNGGVFDFRSPVFHPDFINSVFKPKTAEKLNNKVEIYKFVSHQNAQFKELSFNQGLNYLSSLKPKDGASALDWERYNATMDAFNKQYDKLHSKPLDYVLSNQIAGAKRIDDKKPLSWGEETRTRILADRTLQKEKGVALKSLFDPEEVEVMERLFETKSPRETATALWAIRTEAGFDSEMTRKFGSSFKNPSLGLALSLISEDDPETAISIIDGGRILDKANRSSFDKDKTQRAYTEFDAKFQAIANVGLVLPYGSDRNEVISGYRYATLAVMASDAVSSNKTMLEYSKGEESNRTLLNPLTWLNGSTSNIQKAFNKVTGGGYKDACGSKVLAPRGMDEYHFSAEFEIRAKSVLKQAGYLMTKKGTDISHRVNSYTYYNLPDNKYGILGPARTSVLNEKTGKPLIIDFNSPLSSEDNSLLEYLQNRRYSLAYDKIHSLHDELYIDKEFVSQWEERGNIRGAWKD